MWTGWHRAILTTAALLALVSAAQAARFEVETQVGPETATQPEEGTAGCDGDGFANGDSTISDDGQRVIVLADSFATIAGTACDDEASVSQSAAQSIGTLVGEEGGSFLICASARVLQSAAAEGDGFGAESRIGGGFADPPPLAMELLLNGSPIFSFGPNNLTDPASASEAFVDEIEVEVGDMIEMRATGIAVAFAEAGPNAGAASARARGELILSIGGCEGVMAPAASPIGLAVLAACLALLGGLRAAPRPRR